jgi:hypothetical protein
VPDELPRKRLDGWKQIGDYLGVATRTAQRYKSDDPTFPVYFHRSRAFAFQHELDQWRQRTTVTPSGFDQANVPAEPTKQISAPPTIPIRKLIGLAGVALCGLLLLLLVRQTKSWSTRLPNPSFMPDRLFTRLTSEGSQPDVLLLDYIPEQLIASKDGKKVYTIERNGRHVTVIDAIRPRILRTLQLPSTAGLASLTHDGRLIYVASRVEGVMSIDTQTDSVRNEVLPTHGPVWDVALTPDRHKMFLTMGAGGLKRISLDTGELHEVSDRVYPIFVELDASGEKLLVTYQNGGPGGRPGHDAFEIYDTKSETVLATLSGPPMVGGDPIVAPKGGLVWLDGWDACSTPGYDHLGCPLVPSQIFHLFRLGDRKVIQSMALPLGTGKGTFVPDGTRIAFAGSALTVLDTAKYTLRERFGRSHEPFGRIVFTPRGDRAFVSHANTKELLAFDVEDTTCSGQQEGLSNFFPGDGILEDTQDLGSLIAHGNVGFEPGIVGQAFRFTGNGSYLQVGSHNSCYLCNRSWTVSLYVKFAPLEKEMTIIERGSINDEAHGYRCFRSKDNRLILNIQQGDERISTSAVKGGSWNHLAIVGDGAKFSLFINGRPEATGQLSRSSFIDHWSGSVFLGNSATEKSPLNGWLDEVGFWSLGLDAAKIDALYNIRNTKPCQP